MSWPYYFTNVGQTLRAWGVFDVLLPFLLVFTIVFAILQKSEILGKDKRQFNVVIALVLGLMFVAPHITGTYYRYFRIDPVEVINNALPQISLVVIAAVMVMLMIGLFFPAASGTLLSLLALAGVIFVIYIFGASAGFWAGPYQTWGWWTPELTSLLIVIIVFGVIIWWITKEPKPAGAEGWGTKLEKFLKGGK